MLPIENRATGVVLLDDADGVRTITLNRPECLNAINMAMILELREAVASAQRDAHVNVLLLRGAGRAFCAGDDVTEQSQICERGEEALREQLRHLQAISEMLTLGDKIAVAEVRGWAIGAGFSWSLNCDFRIWSEGTRACFPEVGFGSFVTGGATCLLPRLIGPAPAADLLFLGTRVEALSAPRGLVHAVHPEAQTQDAALQLARKLAKLPQPAAREMKRALVAGIEADFRAALLREIEACVATTLKPGTLARMRASIDKA